MKKIPLYGVIATSFCLTGGLIAEAGQLRFGTSIIIVGIGWGLAALLKWMEEG